MIGRKQHHRVHIQADRNALDVVDGDIARAAFDMRDEGAVQAALERQSLLREAEFTAQQHHVNRKQRAGDATLRSGILIDGMGVSHASECRQMNRLRQPLLHHN